MKGCSDNVGADFDICNLIIKDTIIFCSLVLKILFSVHFVAHCSSFFIRLVLRYFILFCTVCSVLPCAYIINADKVCIKSI